MKFTQNERSDLTMKCLMCTSTILFHTNYGFRFSTSGIRYAVKPVLTFLSDPIYKGANEEFLNAHDHYRKGRYKESLNDCLKAFESCLKIICKKNSWNYSEKDTANRLIEIVFKHNLIDPLMKSHFTALRSSLESGVPTVRNRLSGHGQGPEEIIVPEYIAAYILHLTASNIHFLAKADEELK